MADVLTAIPTKITTVAQTRLSPIDSDDSSCPTYCIIRLSRNGCEKIKPEKSKRGTVIITQGTSKASTLATAKQYRLDLFAVILSLTLV